VHVRAVSPTDGCRSCSCVAGGRHLPRTSGVSCPHSCGWRGRSDRNPALIGRSFRRKTTQGARERGGRSTAITRAPRAPQYTHSHPETEPEPKPYPGSCGCPSEPVFMWPCSRADKCVAVTVRSRPRVPGMGCTCVPGRREAAGDRPGGHHKTASRHSGAQHVTMCPGHVL
jgi:hypothetical protein